MMTEFSFFNSVSSKAKVPSHIWRCNKGNSMDIEQSFRHQARTEKKDVQLTFTHLAQVAVPNIMPRGSCHSKDKVIKSF